MSLKQYFLGFPENVDGSAQSHRELEAVHVDKALTGRVDTHVEFEYDNAGALIDAKVFSAGVQETEKGLFQISQKWIALGKHKYQQYRLNKPEQFVRDENGPSYLGGNPPEGFKIPATSLGHPFQYLGMLSHKEPVFELDFDLHLVCPIYLNLQELWLDYSDPLNPKVLNDEVLIEADTEFLLKAEDKIIYEKIHFSTDPWPSDVRHGGHAGAPLWIQYPQVPVCPKTGSSMPLICELGDTDMQTDKEKSIIPKNSDRNFTLGDGLDKYVNEMDFWGAGDLYVFYCKESKIAYYVIQNT